jgi:hypothetical protein
MKSRVLVCPIGPRRGCLRCTSGSFGSMAFSEVHTQDPVRTDRSALRVVSFRTLDAGRPVITRRRAPNKHAIWWITLTPGARSERTSGTPSPSRVLKRSLPCVHIGTIMHILVPIHTRAWAAFRPSAYRTSTRVGTGATQAVANSSPILLRTRCSTDHHDRAVKEVGQR